MSGRSQVEEWGTKAKKKQWVGTGIIKKKKKNYSLIFFFFFGNCGGAMAPASPHPPPPPPKSVSETQKVCVSDYTIESIYNISLLKVSF